MPWIQTKSICAAATALALVPVGLAAQSVEPATMDDSPDSRVEVVRPPVLPRAIASFGAATTESYLWVFGGHVGRAHEHSRENLSGAFWRVGRELEGAAWEQLPDGPPLQGTSLVAAPSGDVIRVGGLDARNGRGEDEDLWSVASVERFDHGTLSWQPFPPLPEPRSSHDAIVVGGTLYVVGGWQLAGEAEPVWHGTAWACDLEADREPHWTSLPAPPFERRACALARFGEKVAVVGGMDELGTTSEVSLFDPATGEWSAAPDLPGEAFGAAAIGVGDSLFATVMDGRVFRLDRDASAWEPITNLGMPRFFHRLSVTRGGDELVALGGASRSGHMRHVEFVPIDARRADHRMHEWTLPQPNDASHRAAWIWRRDTAYAFGGNRATSRERFAADQFVGDGFAIDLASMTTRRTATLPAPRQSMVAVRWGRGPNENLLLGGLGPIPGRGTVGTSNAALTFDHRTNTLLSSSALPTPRTQFQAVVHGGKVWLFGGTDFRPDARGRGDASHPLDVLVLDPSEQAPTFRPAGVELPSPRRSFGIAVLGAKAYLIGGLAEGFDAATHVDVFDFETLTWERRPAPPKAWVSPQVATIGDRVYVACGGTMRGMRFTPDASLASFDEDGGWQTVIPELPFTTRHVHMHASRDRLVFVDLRTQGSVTVRSVRPPQGITIVEAGFGH